MFGISGEHLLILAIVLIFFGPRRLPELGRSLGKTMKNFRDGLAGVEEAQFRKLDSKPEASSLTQTETSQTQSEKKES